MRIRILLLLLMMSPLHAEERVTARELGLVVGIFSPGQHNDITDVSGVNVGHVTLLKDKSVRTGVTAILPHNGNLYRDKVPAAAVIGNGYGKLMGFSQIEELGEIETPILLTNTLNVPRVADAVLDWTLARNPEARSVNAVVGETNDGYLNDIRARHVNKTHVHLAIGEAASGPIEQGSVGAGTGTIAFGWKGGIGSSSRRLPESLGSFSVGVLVQSNFGGVLQMDGIPVGESLGQYYLSEHGDDTSADGSIMVIVATDAPLSDRNLKRLARRALGGLARTGASMTNGSGDYVIAFSTAKSVRRTPERREGLSTLAELPNDRLSPLFQAVIEATEEAIYNSLLMATSIASYNPVLGRDVEIKKLPVAEVKALMEIGQ